MSIEMEVKFHEEALKEWREAWPNLPPGDEIVLTVRIEPCSVCGAEPNPNEIGGLDPIGVTEDGLMIADYVCLKCMKEGH